jgi:hypothetical protein
MLDKIGNITSILSENSLTVFEKKIQELATSTNSKLACRAARLKTKDAHNMHPQE